MKGVAMKEFQRAPQSPLLLKSFPNSDGAGKGVSIVPSDDGVKLLSS